MAGAKEMNVWTVCLSCGHTLSHHQGHEVGVRACVENGCKCTGFTDEHMPRTVKVAMSPFEAGMLIAALHNTPHIADHPLMQNLTLRIDQGIG